MIVRCGFCKEVIPGDWHEYVVGICAKCRAEAYFTADRLHARECELRGETPEWPDEPIH